MVISKEWNKKLSHFSTYFSFSLIEAFILMIVLNFGHIHIFRVAIWSLSAFQDIVLGCRSHRPVLIVAGVFWHPVPWVGSLHWGINIWNLFLKVALILIIVVRIKRLNTGLVHFYVWRFFGKFIHYQIFLEKFPVNKEIQFFPHIIELDRFNMQVFLVWRERVIELGDEKLLYHNESLLDRSDFRIEVVSKQLLYFLH